MALSGMMADNMFAGKQTILTWLNTALQLRLEKIEDTCSGAVACQLMDCLHPGSINMRKVDFNMKNEYEYVSNYKELQKAFMDAGITRQFNPTALSKGKLQDNNEFMQWFFGYWDSVVSGQEVDYEGVARRQAAKSGDWKKFSLGAGAGAGARQAPGTIPAVRRGSAAPAAPRAAPAAASKVPLQRMGAKAASSGPSRASSASTEQLEQAQQDAETLREQVTELKLKVKTAERERDFYFEKLRDIEILCQAPELQEIPAIRIVEKILYAADAAEAKEAMAEASQMYGANFEQAAEAEAAGGGAAEVAVTGE